MKKNLPEGESNFLNLNLASEFEEKLQNDFIKGNDKLSIILIIFNFIVAATVLFNPAKNSILNQNFIFYSVSSIPFILYILNKVKQNELLTNYPLHNYFFLFLNYLFSNSFHILYYLAQESPRFDSLLTCVSLEFAIKYYFILNHYYCWELYLLSALIGFLHFIVTYYLFFKYLAEEFLVKNFPFFYFLLVSFTVGFCFFYEKYKFFINFEKLHEVNHKLLKLMKESKLVYLICDEKNVLFKSKHSEKFWEDLLNLVEDRNFLLEDDFDDLDHTRFVLEYLFHKGSCVEFINKDLSLGLINYLVEEEEKCDIKIERFDDNLGKTVENIINEVGVISGEKKLNINTSGIRMQTSPFFTDDSDEEKFLNEKKNVKQSLFKKQINSSNSKIEKKNKLEKLHTKILENFSDDLIDKENFTHLFTVPLIINENEYFLQISIKLSRNKENLFRFEYLIRDVTKEKQAENLKNEMRCKSLFLAKIAHEFKNPIITINSLCQTLNSKITQIININTSYQSSDYDSEEEQKNPHNMSKRKSSYMQHSSLQESVNFIINTGNYLMSLIYDLNYFTKIELGNPNKIASAEVEDQTNRLKETEFDLLSALEFCLKIFRERQKNDDNKKNVTILSEYDKRLPEKIFACELKLKQILINLLSNSYKFTIRGKITLSVKVLDRNCLRFEVSDTGTGIPKEKLEKIGNPFSLNDKNQSMNSYGSGLGLFIVKDLLRQIGTNLCFTSEEDVGSKFWFDLCFNKIKNEPLLMDAVSSKTIVRKPLVNESLKKIYLWNYSNNLQDSSETGNSNKNFCESVNETEPKKRQTLKNLFYNRTSKNNLRISDPETGDSVSHQDSSELTSPPSLKMRINNISRKHILEAKFSPFNPIENKPPKKSPICKNIGLDGKAKLKDIIEGIECKNKIKISDLDSKNSLRIMVCEDHSSMRETIVRLISKVAEEKKISVDVKESINGLECLYMVYQACLSGNSFDAVLLDETMPFMKGSKCMSILKDMYKDGSINKLKTVSISCFDDQEMIRFIKSQGCDEFLPKPHTKETINKFLDSLIV